MGNEVSVIIEYWDAVELLARLIAKNDPRLGSLEQLIDYTYFHDLLDRKGMGTRVGWYDLAYETFKENKGGSIAVKENTVNGVVVRDYKKAPNNVALLYDLSTAIKNRTEVILTLSNFLEVVQQVGMSINYKKVMRWTPDKKHVFFQNSEWDLYISRYRNKNEHLISKFKLSLGNFGAAFIQPASVIYDLYDQSKINRESPSQYSGRYDFDSKNSSKLLIDFLSTDGHESQLVMEFNVGKKLPFICYGRLIVLDAESFGTILAIRNSPESTEIKALNNFFERELSPANRDQTIIDKLLSVSYFHLPDCIDKISIEDLKSVLN